MALIHQAASSNILDLAERCLDTGARVNEVDPEHGRTALHYAAEKGHAQMVRFLLTRGAVRDAIDAYGLTPLELAEENGHAVVVALLSGKPVPQAPVSPGASAPVSAPTPLPSTPGAQATPSDAVHVTCPSCGEVLKVPRQYLGARGKCRACGVIFVATPSAPAPAAVPPNAQTFEDRYVSTLDEALAVVMQEALPAVWIQDESLIRQNYRQIAKVWRSDELVEASMNGIKGIIQKNMKAIAARTDFEEFQIVVDTEGISAVQIIATCSAASRPIAIRVWRGPNRYFACGGSDFIGHA